VTLDPNPRFVFALLVLMALPSIAGCRREAPDEVDIETAVAVKTAPATVGTIRGVVHATAIVAPSPGAELVVVAPDAARIAEVPRAPGDRVRRGDLLVRFEIPSSQADAQRQQAEVARAQATLDNARRAQVRARELFDRGVAARKEVEDADRAIADAEAALAQGRASLTAAQAVASRSIVRAPFDGIVASRQHNPGDLVEPTASDTVLRLIDPLRLEVVAEVSLPDVPRLEIGATARLTSTPVGAPEVALKVISRPAAVEPGMATVPVRLAFVAPAAFPSGMAVEVDIDAEQHSNVVLVPAAAIVREGEETAVFVAVDGKARRRPVKIGVATAEHVEIVSGVRAGEPVIVDGQAGLPDDAAITASEAK
jgi:RND family efflux transporter MFP subunit